MANRLTTERGAEQGLWVSRPGQNVLTANNADLLFTSDWPVLGVVESGSRTINMAPTTSGNSGTYNESTFFSVPFSSVPVVQKAIVIGGQTRTFASGGEVSIVKDVLVDGGSYASYSLRTVTHVNRIQFIGRWDRNLGYTIPTITITWKVFAYNF